MVDHTMFATAQSYKVPARKSSVAGALSARTGWPMIEADDHHSEANVEKQAAGIPLTDLDRADWIDNMVAEINQSGDDHMLLACSALTPYVQDRFIKELSPQTHWFLIDVSREELARRLASRSDHFMPASLLQSQFDALEDPTDEEDVFKVTIDQTLEAIVAQIVAAR